MSQIERNSLVTIFYRLGLPNGDVLEDNFDDEPMTVQLGCGEMAEGLELALIGLREGEEETIDIRPDLAFGYIDETLFRSIPRIEFDPDLELEPGLIIEFATEEGETLPGTILDFNEDEVRVDLNHPLAGQTVRYSVRVVSIDNDSEPKTLH
ncbi:MAG: peptidylprolyl isomerase [Gammaproteobacteria bacterium]|nr:MAG: peptidylprolyl isomerase [Gammaproteobacteria bacterium]UCH39358.1 MAG: peptidylprolyl isomerase [Gammaproteobacteria bacterium]